ncbi:MAG: hypothetical protein ACKN9Y_04785 [Bacteroidota bacterium]
MRMKLRYLIVSNFCLMFLLNNFQGFATTQVEVNKQEKIDKVNRIEAEKYLIIDVIDWESSNSGKAKDITDYSIDIARSVYNIPSNYDLPIINVSSEKIIIDSISVVFNSSDILLNTKNFPDTLLPGEKIRLNIDFLHTRPGDALCKFKLHTNLSKIKPGIDFNSANPTFTIKSIVLKGNLDYARKGCNKFYLNTINESCSCNCIDSVIFFNNGSYEIEINSIVLNGNANYFNINPILLPNQSIVISPNSNYVISIKHNPSNDTGVFNGELIVKTKDNDSLIPIDISFKAVRPSVQVLSDSIKYMKPGTFDTIPFRIGIVEAPSIQVYNSLSSFRFSIPKKSLRSIHYPNFVLEKGIDTALQVGRFNNSLDDELHSDSLRFLQTGDAVITNNINLQHVIGRLSFKYFYNELISSEIVIDTVNIRTLDMTPCYKSVIPLEKPFTIKIKNVEENADYYCGKNDIDFFSNLRDSTNDFTAAMRVSGEPVMEIQHYLKEPIQTEINLYSINGMKLETIFSGMAKADLQQIRHPMSHLPPGVYLCEMIAGQFRKTIPIILNR